MKAIDMQVGRSYRWADPHRNHDGYQVWKIGEITYNSKFAMLGEYFGNDYTVEGDRMITVRTQRELNLMWTDRNLQKGYDLPADWEVELIED